MIIHAETRLIFVTYHCSTQLPKPQRKRMNRRETKTLNTPQEHIAEKLQHWDIELAKKRNTLRQKQYFENSQKYLGRLERASISKNHNEHF